MKRTITAATYDAETKTIYGYVEPEKPSRLQRIIARIARALI